MKRIFFISLCIALFQCQTRAEDSTQCVNPTDSINAPSFALTDDDNTKQNENEELQEYRPDTDQAEDNGNINQYGYDGSDGSTKTD